MEDEKIIREYVMQMAEYTHEARQAIEKCIDFSNDYSAKNKMPFREKALFVLSWRKSFECMLELLSIAENQFEQQKNKI